MEAVFKILEKLSFCIATVTAKVRWGNAMSVDGIFRKRRDTQIILSEGGKMRIGKAVRFQRNVSLTSVGRGGANCALETMSHLTAIVS